MPHPHAVSAPRLDFAVQNERTPYLFERISLPILAPVFKSHPERLGYPDVKAEFLLFLQAWYEFCSDLLAAIPTL